ncbi:MAG: flavocytochrome c [Solobacterium sp.]|nr:flavocytochrome c [Solobacterium sp.]
MKKTIAIIMSGLLLAGCGQSAVTSTQSVSSAEEETAGLFTPGTYSAAAPGRNGDVTVEATFSGDKIEDIQITSEETENIGVVAMEQMKETILAAQALDVDLVSGATLSSEAFLNALKEDVRQAGADPDSLTGAEKEEASATEYETEADIIVVGAGAAGMTAAITATENGAKVILLEKSNVLGGNTVCAANGINGADSQVQLNNETYQEKGASVEGLESLQLNNEDANENLVKAFAENSGETLDWLGSLGVNFEVDIQDDERNPEKNYYMVKDTTDGSTAITMINRVSDKLKDLGITVYYSMDAHDLTKDADGAVNGVVATDANGDEITFTGKAVLLATGGFGQNSELVGQYNEHLANAVTDEVAPTTGEGLLMALSAGADTVNMDAIQTFPAVIPGYGMILPFNLPGGFTPDALYVNNSAERFTAEGFEIPDAILAQDKGEVYCVFDDSGMNDGLQNLMNLGYVKSGETAAELAEELGIDGAALQKTIESFNEDIADGTDDAFGREQNLNPIEGTLYGYRFGVGAHYFMGGVLINEKTQVMDTEGNPISGLYAAGEVTGGFHGTFRVDGSGLGDSFTFGRIAGRELAEAVK